MIISNAYHTASPRLASVLASVVICLSIISVAFPRLICCFPIPFCVRSSVRFPLPVPIPFVKSSTHPFDSCILFCLSALRNGSTRLVASLTPANPRLTGSSFHILPNMPPVSLVALFPGQAGQFDTSIMPAPACNHHRGSFVVDLWR
ncbi:uncharacterized protein BO97DRAFT_268886 [Aspergillus homomorphus CBS 101889]|uniref:Uncharacterized protein n=1 Tax=Aspergillus homomorphus (strain CBS 101889) TaxID=1450537 RepID=A0A395HGJ1_ASPHC|nr:hypothetical protein BO97DRAFT_268886 [Aspergillus homomorphus CBS 101889]RAL07022.1 hypothetical protein BO97DRAFT_268886 [Aspergillus homomorphus CBS 101889]